MKNILLVMTGGTIGSVTHGETINTSRKTASVLLELFQRHYPKNDRVRFKSRQLSPILSENIQPAFWRHLIEAIETEDLHLFDGIIVTHGTDTLAFSSAMLGLYFHQLEIPLLLVSSHLPLEAPDANGLQNFICAVDYIVQQQPAAVLVPYQNPGQHMVVHLATRLLSSLPLSSDFISTRFNPWMRYEKGRFYLVDKTGQHPRQIFNLAPRFDKKILLIKPYPGLDYRHFNLEQVDCVLHDLYHSGTACATEASSPYSLLYFLSTCQSQNIPVFLAPIIKQASAYDSTQQLKEHSAEFIWNMTLEAAYAKLLLALGNFDTREQIRHFLDSNLADEVLPSL
jgi:L-asparaginase